MQFTLQTLLLSVVLIWSSLAAFGPWGLLVAALLLGIVAYIRTAQSMQMAALRVFVAVFLVLLSAFLLAPFISVAREAARRTMCKNNQKQIALGLLNYHDAHGHFPPAYVLGPDGKPWHSWRVLILPYMGLNSLYQQYRFDEPWNGPNNRKLAATVLSEFTCPSDPAAFAPGSANTNYFAVVGPGTAWPGEKPSRLADFAGVAGRTIMLVEVVNSGINWLEPRDLTFEEACAGINLADGIGISSRHVRDGGYFYYDQPGIVNVACVDGSVWTLPPELPRETLAAALRGEAGSLADLLDGGDYGPPASKRVFRWDHVGGLIALVLSFLLLLLRPRHRHDD